MPERVSVPGFREGRRYRDLGGSPRYLLLAECAQPEVAESGEWQAPWTGLDGATSGGGPPIVHVIREAFRIDYVLAAP